MKFDRLRSRSDFHKIGGVGAEERQPESINPAPSRIEAAGEEFPQRGVDEPQGNAGVQIPERGRLLCCLATRHLSGSLAVFEPATDNAPQASLRTHDKLDHRPQVVGHFQSSAPQPASLSIASTIG